MKIFKVIPAQGKIFSISLQKKIKKLPVKVKNTYYCETENEAIQYLVSELEKSIIDYSAKIENRRKLLEYWNQKRKGKL